MQTYRSTHEVAQLAISPFLGEFSHEYDLEAIALETHRHNGEVWVSRDLSDGQLLGICEKHRYDSARTWLYTAKDGEQVAGNFTQIGDKIMQWHGDRATQDNPEPWLIIDDYGNETPKPATLEEMVAWLSRAEDRPSKHTAAALSVLREYSLDDVTAAHQAVLEAEHRLASLRNSRNAIAYALVAQGASVYGIAKATGVTQRAAQKWVERP